MGIRCCGRWPPGLLAVGLLAVGAVDVIVTGGADSALGDLRHVAIFALAAALRGWCVPRMRRGS